MTKIEIKDLSILFGPEKAKAKKMVKQGKSKQEIVKEVKVSDLDMDAAEKGGYEQTGNFKRNRLYHSCP